MELGTSVEGFCVEELDVGLSAITTFVLLDVSTKLIAVGRGAHPLLVEEDTLSVETSLASTTSMDSKNDNVAPFLLSSRGAF